MASSAVPFVPLLLVGGLNSAPGRIIPLTILDGACFIYLRSLCPCLGYVTYAGITVGFKIPIPARPCSFGYSTDRAVT